LPPHTPGECGTRDSGFQRLLLIQTSMLSIKTFRILLIFFFFSCIISTLFTLFLYLRAISLDGPNSTGEAGKVYYAHKFQMGENILSDGKTPPYYPAFHGILLHASVGEIGRLLGANIDDLYYIGRSISTLAALLSLLIIFIICQRLLGDYKWAFLALPLFLAPFRLQQFASSYRPDHWIICISLLSCLICLRRPRGAWVFLLAVLPTISYLIKAPGVIIAGCIFFSFLVDKRYKVALLYAFCSGAFLLITLGFLQWITEGLFWAAFLGGVKTGFSVSNILAAINYPTIWFPILMVPIIYVYLYKHSNIEKMDLLIILIFWGVETLLALVTSGRYGSYFYYFLQSYAYGTIFFICWLCSAWHQVANNIALSRFNKISLFTILFIGAFLIITPIKRYKNLDDAISLTLYFGKHRHSIAEFLNQNSLKCYSDDPGLNVLLNNPVVLYPYLQNVLFRSGYLDKQSFLEQIRRGEFDIIILTGRNWSYQGITQFPEEFMPLVDKYYQPLPRDPARRYSFYLPKYAISSKASKIFLLKAFLSKSGA
jgi:hypothetical protein